MLKMTRFILNPSATFRQVTIQGVDVGLWEINPTEVLVLATNTNYSPVSIPITYFGLSFNGINLEQVLDTGIEIDSDRANIIFESVGSGAFIIKPIWRYFTTAVSLKIYMKDQIVGKAERAYGKAEQLVNNLKDSELEQVNLASPEENKNLLSYFLFLYGSDFSSLYLLPFPNLMYIAVFACT